MGIFKNEVGRPSNEVVKKRRIIKCVIAVLVIIIFGLLAYIINDKLEETKTNSSKNEELKEEKEEQINKENDKDDTTQSVEKGVKTLNIYGYINEAIGMIGKSISISDKEINEYNNEKYTFLGSYECTNKDCSLLEQESYDLTSVVIKDGSYFSYNFNTKVSNKLQLDEYLDELKIYEESEDMCSGVTCPCIKSKLIDNKTYYEFATIGDVERVNILVGPDYKPIFVMGNDNDWASYLTYLDNGNIVYFKDDKLYTYISSTKKTKITKEFKKAVLISEGYVVGVDLNNHLKVYDIDGFEKAKLGKVTNDMLIHELLSGWYEEDKKEGIYVVVEDPSVSYSQLSEKMQKELGGQPELYDYGYEYYYIPKTGEIGKIATYIGGYAKPVLYLYPKKDNTKISVKFARPDILTTTYPKFKNKWEVTANKNGDLYDLNNKYYYGLYWEEKGTIKVDFETGFYVTRDNAIEFLEDKLSVIGLSGKERNEFIMYWLPVLEKNEKSLVYFELTSSRENYNKLIINPKPDSLLRMAIHIKKVDKKMDIKEQKLTSFKRKGFTAVEWGGVIH